MRLFRSLPIAAALLLATAPAVWPEATTVPPQTAPASLPAITVSTVGTRPLTDRVLAAGLVAAVEEVQVAPLIEGQQIEVLLADVGDRVEAGQVLARLSTSTLELQKSQIAAQVAAAKAQVAQAEAGLVEARARADEANRVNTRTATLRAQGTASQAAADQASAAATSADAGVLVAQQMLESARANQTLAEAQAANIDLQLSRTEVKAPVAGEITARNARTGAIASAASGPMFVLIRDGALEMRADIAERDLLRLAPGQKATLRLAGGGADLSATVRLVEPGIDPASRLGRARLTIDDPTQVRPGMFAEATIIITTHDAVAIPVTAVGSANGESTVMKVTDGIVSRVEIATGIRDGGWVEVLSGLKGGETIVTKAGAFVRSGDRIQPVAAAAETN